MRNRGQKIQQFKVQSIWKQSLTMAGLQQASCQTVCMLVFPGYVVLQPPWGRQEEFWMMWTDGFGIL